MYRCLAVSPTGALLRVSDAEFRVHVVVEAIVACPEPEQDDLLSSGEQVVGISLVVLRMLMLPLILLFGLDDGFGF